jgi:hypothetical protein
MTLAGIFVRLWVPHFMRMDLSFLTGTVELHHSESGEVTAAGYQACGHRVFSRRH